ncbi:hypothetical protein X975_14179, partial [Stegodyphus mimosarum]
MPLYLPFQNLVLLDNEALIHQNDLSRNCMILVY